MLAAERKTLNIKVNSWFWSGGGFSVIWAPCPTILLLFTRFCQSNNKYCTSQHESASPIIGKVLEEEM